MASYGFRLFELTAHRHGEEGPLDWAEDGALYELMRSARLLADGGTRFGKPRAKVQASEDVKQSPPSLTVSAVQEIDPGRHLHLAVSQGELGLHDRAVRPGADAIEIDDAAAETVHRIDVWIPADNSPALCAVETVGGRDPWRFLLAWLREVNATDVKDHRASEASLARSARERGEKYEKGAARAHLYLRSSPVSDFGHINRLIEEANNAEAVFTSLVLSDRSPDGVEARHVLKMGLKTPEEREHGRNAVIGWTRQRLERMRSKEGLEQAAEVGRTAVVRLEEDLALDDEALSAAGLTFDDVAVVLHSETYGTRTFTPAHVQEAFTYYVASGQASHGFYYDRVIEMVQPIAATDFRSVTIRSGQETATWLTDSASAHSSETSHAASENADPKDPNP